jgi:hypothetical protein
MHSEFKDLVRLSDLANHPPNDRQHDAEQKETGTPQAHTDGPLQLLVQEGPQSFVSLQRFVDSTFRRLAREFVSAHLEIPKSFGGEFRMGVELLPELRYLSSQVLRRRLPPREGQGAFDARPHWGRRRLQHLPRRMPGIACLLDDQPNPADFGESARDDQDRAERLRVHYGAEYGRSYESRR